MCYNSNQSANPLGEARSDLEIMSPLWLRMRRAYQEKGGKYPDPILKMNWTYVDPESPTLEELAMEFNGRAPADVTDPTDKTKVSVKKGDQLPSFAMLRDDGSTSSGCWIFCGTWTQAGNQIRWDVATTRTRPASARR